VRSGFPRRGPRGHFGHAFSGETVVGGFKCPDLSLIAPRGSSNTVPRLFSRAHSSTLRATDLAVSDSGALRAPRVLTRGGSPSLYVRYL
jgi:hypothetical protein